MYELPLDQVDMRFCWAMNRLIAAFGAARLRLYSSHGGEGQIVACFNDAGRLIGGRFLFCPNGASASDRQFLGSDRLDSAIADWRGRLDW